MGIEPMISPLLGERGADCAKAPYVDAVHKMSENTKKGYFADLLEMSI